MLQSAQEGGEAFSERQREVLEVALQLLVEGGEKALTTAKLARSANCSKESLYKWFGDRDDLLAAIVTHQASKVRVIEDGGAPRSAEEFEQALIVFAEDLMRVLFSDTSLALNRLSIGAVRGEEAGLGQVLLERGKQRIEDRAKRLLEAGRRHRLITYDDAEETYQTLYGLIIGDLHMRGLLGDTGALSRTDTAVRARAAIATFWKLHAAGQAV